MKGPAASCWDEEMAGRVPRSAGRAVGALRNEHQCSAFRQAQPAEVPPPRCHGAVPLWDQGWGSRCQPRLWEVSRSCKAGGKAGAHWGGDVVPRSSSPQCRGLPESCTAAETLLRFGLVSCCCPKRVKNFQECLGHFSAASPLVAQACREKVFNPPLPTLSFCGALTWCTLPRVSSLPHKTVSQCCCLRFYFLQMTAPGLMPASPFSPFLHPSHFFQLHPTAPGRRANHGSSSRAGRQIKGHGSPANKKQIDFFGEAVIANGVDLTLCPIVYTQRRTPRFLLGRFGIWQALKASQWCMG